MSKQYKTVSLSDDQRIALEALCRRRKVDALVWKRARAFLLLDAGEDAETVCRILDIGPTVLTEWRFAFVAAGFAKLSGQEMMVQTFEAVGVGQWFRYVTGVIEVVAAVLLWVGGMQFVGAGLLTCTMAGAALAHLVIIGPSAVPALVLGVLSAIVAYHYRAQLGFKHQVQRLI
jgi:putative oxidoreductase